MVLAVNAQLACSFCGRSASEVRRLLGGKSAHICDDCIETSRKILAATPSNVCGWGKMSDNELLSALSSAEAAVDGARTVLQAQVNELRTRKVSWQAIGAALGISRQAAWERFS